jgi:hypothetical protein
MKKIHQILDTTIDFCRALPDLSNGVLIWVLFVTLPIPLYFLGWVTAAVWIAPFCFAPLLWARLWSWHYGHLDYEPIVEPGHFAGFLFYYFPIFAVVVIALGHIFLLNNWSVHWSEVDIVFLLSIAGIVTAAFILMRLIEKLNSWMLGRGERRTKNGKSMPE